MSKMFALVLTAGCFATAGWQAAAAAPACFSSDGWQPTSSGAGIEVWYFHEPQHISTAEQVTAVVTKKDGSTETLDSTIEAGQQVHRFEFPAIPQSAVADVFFDTPGGRCLVAAPGS